MSQWQENKGFLFTCSTASSSLSGCYKSLHPYKYHCFLSWGLPCGSAGKESACHAGDLSLIPGLGRSPGEGKGCPFQYYDLETSMDCIVHGVAELDTSDFHFLLSWPVHVLGLCAFQVGKKFKLKFLVLWGEWGRQGGLCWALVSGHVVFLWGVWASLSFRLLGSVAVTHQLSCPKACGILISDRDWTHIPCLERWILNHWATRKSLQAECEVTRWEEEKKKKSGFFFCVTVAKSEVRGKYSCMWGSVSN